MLPFVRQFYGTPSTFWCTQGEGGEQGDALMPLLFSLGLHSSLCAIRDRLLPSERLLAFLDDIYVICSPDQVVALQEELWAHSRMTAARMSDPTTRRCRALNSICCVLCHATEEYATDHDGSMRRCLNCLLEQWFGALEPKWLCSDWAHSVVPLCRMIH